MKQRERRLPGRSILARTASDLHEAIRETLYSEEVARRKGLLQALDPRTKIIGCGALLLSAASTRRLTTLIALFAIAIVIAGLSRIPVGTLARRAWGSVLLLTLALAVPALFLTPGEIALRLPLGATVTWPGLRSAGYLLLRVETAATFSALLILSTPWMHVLKGLRVLRIPVILVVILSLTCRYIILLLQTAEEMFEARESRRVGKMPAKAQRQVMVSSVGVLFAKTMSLSEDVFLAMRSRGYRGEVYLLSNFTMCGRDWVAMAAFLSIASTPLWLD